jgi:hypothetical protein
MRCCEEWDWCLCVCVSRTTPPFFLVHLIGNTHARSTQVSVPPSVEG